MPNHLLLSQPWLAQAPTKPKVTKPTTNAATNAVNAADAAKPWMAASGGLLLLIAILGVVTKLQFDKMQKKARFEEIKNRELQKKLKYAVETIAKMEKNPDLIHSREFNLDYLRMRMSEEVFHFAILNQIKVKVKEKITLALRPSQANQGAIGIASKEGRQIDEMFDVEYEPGDLPKGTKRVLFRIEIKMLKLPTQPTSVTINQIIECIETYLSASEDHDTWQPTIQGRIANMHWDQKAKPTPLLVLEQTQEGSNVTFRTTRMAHT
jgi:hypothetical protein